MRHLDDGVLRRMIDEPVAVRDSQRQHYRGCERCKQRYAEISTQAGAVATLLGSPLSTVNSAAALNRVRGRIVAEGLQPRRRLFRFTGIRAPRRGGIAAVATALALAGAIAFTPAGSLAQDVITIFQPSQVVPVPVTVNDMRTLSELAQYGTLTGPTGGNAHSVSSAQDASTESGMDVQTPGSLPADVTGNPEYEVIGPQSATFTFDAQKAATAAEKSGKTLPPMPAGLDGSMLEVTTGAGVLTSYRGDGSIPSLVIGQMKSPVITAHGVTVGQLENYLLSMPEVSPQLAAEIRAINDPETALPIPVPVDRAYSHSVEVQGVHGLAVGDSTGTGSAVVWQKDGVLHGVAGPLSDDEVLSIANGLH